MSDIDRREPAFLPDLSSYASLLVASDFAGDHAHSPYQTLTLVIASVDAVAEWDVYRRHLRQRYKLHRRRIAYSKLNDRRKRAASAGFLYLANAISGLAVTILIDKRIGSLFTKHGLLVPSDVDIGGARFKAWKPAAFERMLRSTHLVGVFVAGISSPKQNILWVTDEDAIAPNVPRLRDLTHAFAHVLSGMLLHDVGHIRVGTTGTTAGDDLRVEDYAAIADIIAGSVNDYITCYRTAGAELSSVITLAPPSLSRKTLNLIAMLFDERAPLRKLIFAIECEPGSDRLLFRRIRIHLEPFIVTA